jgi:hypothetical protein
MPRQSTNLLEAARKPTGKLNNRCGNVTGSVPETCTQPWTLRIIRKKRYEIATHMIDSHRSMASSFIGRSKVTPHIP